MITCTAPPPFPPHPPTPPHTTTHPHTHTHTHTHPHTHTHAHTHHTHTHTHTHTRAHMHTHTHTTHTQMASTGEHVDITMTSPHSIQYCEAKDDSFDNIFFAMDAHPSSSLLAVGDINGNITLLVNTYNSSRHFCDCGQYLQIVEPKSDDLISFLLPTPLPHPTLIPTPTPFVA